APGAGTAPSHPTLTPEGRALPPQCSLQLPVLGNLGCILVGLVDGVVSGTVNSVAPVSPAGPAAPALPAPLPPG
ncbi:MAG: hypothetical protein ACRDRV_19105, partial [Pseudonocardiaceae bacterium]